jgi:hypothetical protein
VGYSGSYDNSYKVPSSTLSRRPLTLSRSAAGRAEATCHTVSRRSPAETPGFRRRCSLKCCRSRVTDTESPDSPAGVPFVGTLNTSLYSQSKSHRWRATVRVGDQRPNGKTSEFQSLLQERDSTFKCRSSFRARVEPSTLIHPALIGAKTCPGPTEHI